jgi:hypothetical protein
MPTHTEPNERRFEKILSTDGYNIKKKRRRSAKKSNAQSGAHTERRDDDGGAVLPKAKERTQERL